MKTNDIYLMYVSWGPGGKKRPILVIDFDKTTVTFYAITSSYQYKSKSVQSSRYPIKRWADSGLKKKSYIRVDHLYQSLLEGATVKYVGHLPLTDQQAFLEFLKDYQSR